MNNTNTDKTKKINISDYIILGIVIVVILISGGVIFKKANTPIDIGKVFEMNNKENATYFRVVGDNKAEVADYQIFENTSDTITLPLQAKKYNVKYDVTATSDKGSYDELPELKNVIVPEGYTRIGSMTFRNSSNIESIQLPNTLTSIGYQAFDGCKSLKSIVIPDSVTSIEEETFYNCTNLSSVVLPNNLKEIGTDLFYGCKSLKSIEVPGSLKNLKFDTFVYCTGLEEVKLNEGLKTISRCAFEGCTSLKEVKIPGTVKQIGMYAFDECTRLKRIYVPSSVKEIGEGAFGERKNFTIIYGEKGSEAEKFAKANGFTFKVGGFN